jgi:ankyrin repeat protein
MQLCTAYLEASKIKGSRGEDDVLPTKWEFQEKSDDCNLLGQTPLQLAVEKGFVDVVRILVQRLGVDVDTPDEAGWTALHWACAIRREQEAAADDIAKMLLDAGAAVGTVTKDKGDSALHFAAASGHLRVVKQLVGMGANVNRANDEDATPVHVAAQRGNTDVIKFLNASGGDMARRNSTGGEAAGRGLRLLT